MEKRVRENEWMNGGREVAENKYIYMQTSTVDGRSASERRSPSEYDLIIAIDATSNLNIRSLPSFTCLRSFRREFDTTPMCIVGELKIQYVHVLISLSLSLDTRAVTLFLSEFRIELLSLM